MLPLGKTRGKQRKQSKRKKDDNGKRKNWNGSRYLLVCYYLKGSSIQALEIEKRKKEYEALRQTELRKQAEQQRQLELRRQAELQRQAELRRQEQLRAEEQKRLTEPIYF